MIRTTTDEAAVKTARAGDVLVLTIDNPPVNASSAAVRQGILAGLRELAQDEELTGAVLIGAHGTFVAGSDIREFSGPVPDPLLPAVIAAIESCPKPVVAALDGFALGGGLELALGCDARVATARCRVGLPEVTLGMVPGAGGTQRLPRLAGMVAALELIVTGRRIDAAEAQRLGILDDVVSPDELLDAAVARVRGGVKRVVAQEPVPDEPSDDLDAMADRMLRAGRGRPQVHEAIRLVRQAGTVPVEASLAEERSVFDRLRTGEEAAALRHVFFAERAAGKVPVLKGTVPLRITHVGVIGAGNMGVGIAVALSTHGYRTTLVDTDRGSMERGLTRAREEIGRAVDRGRLAPDAGAAATDLLGGADTIAGLSACDLVIEAVFEDLTVKRGVLAEAERATGGRAILATNTSYLDLEALADGTQDPTRLVGLHFFNPAHVMKLVEVVKGTRTGDAVLAASARLVKDMGKQPVLAGAGEGFIGNRIFSAYRRHVEYLLEDGALPEQVDAALTRFGFAMGPFAVADLSGLQIAWAMRKRQREQGTLPGRYVDIPDLLCEAGRFGRRTGLGYYAYPEDGSGPVADPEVTSLILKESARKGITRRTITDEEIVDRALFAMVNEACLALEERVALRAGDVDVALVHGFGFPRHRGGPLWWASRLPGDRVEAGIAAVAAAAGPSFRPGSVRVVLEEVRASA